MEENKGGMKWRVVLLWLAAFIACRTEAQDFIGDARRMRLGQNVTVSGVVTNGGELGRIRYLQDQTAGIAAYGTAIMHLERGDSVTLTGELKEYMHLLEIDPVYTVTIHSSGNTLPAPVEVAPDEIGENYEGQLVRINQVMMENPQEFFQGQHNYTVTSGSSSLELRTSSSLLADSPMPAGAFDLVGICSQFSYNDEETGYQILPRDPNDILVRGAIRITSPLEVADFSKTSITLTWETDIACVNGVRYGNSPMEKALNAYVSGTLLPSVSGYRNEGVLEDLYPASVIYAQGFSVVENDTAFTSIRAFATESNSTGEIRVYFNTAVDTSFATEKKAMVLHELMDDTLIACINRAEESIDMCIYNINNSGLSNITRALNHAVARGVKVRAIACGTTAHLGVVPNGPDSPEFSVMIAPGKEEREGIMHNKFLVFDARSSDAAKPWVWTGSPNFTAGQINNDANNVVLIQDQSLAKAYTLEFEEMWGGKEMLPDKSAARYGKLKTNNTPHAFRIGKKRVECYFSPSDGTHQVLLSTLMTADKQLDVATMLITRTDIAETIGERYRNGVEVHVLTDNENDNDPGVNTLLRNALGNGFLFDQWAPYIMHHKYAVVDHSEPLEGPLVITGSHNWSSSADYVNDENTLIIHDSSIANQYWQNFAARFSENHGIINEPRIIEDPAGKIQLYPNPSRSIVHILSQNQMQKIEVLRISGEKIFTLQVQATSCRWNTRDYPQGIYLVKIFNVNGKVTTLKLMKI
jgi:phosphatidylserine/phosphatidylglycerophosphate/cardiolipin synthase-like enzyme